MITPPMTPEKLAALMDKHAPPGWREDSQLSDMFAELGWTDPFRAVVLVVDIRASTELMKETKSFYDFGLDLGNFFDVLRQTVHDHHGWFDKFTGDGCIAYWPHRARKEQFLGALKDAYATAREAIRSFRDIQLPKFRLLVRNMPSRSGLSAGIDVGDVYLAAIADDLTILGLPVVGAVRMLEDARSDEVVANVQVGEAVLWERPVIDGNRLCAERVNRKTKNYEAQEVYLLTDATAHSRSESGQGDAASNEGVSQTGIS